MIRMGEQEGPERRGVKNKTGRNIEKNIPLCYQYRQLHILSSVVERKRWNSCLPLESWMIHRQSFHAVTTQQVVIDGSFGEPITSCNVKKALEHPGYKSSSRSAFSLYTQWLLQQLAWQVALEIHFKKQRGDHYQQSKECILLEIINKYCNPQVHE